MPHGRMRRRERVSEEEVMQRWHALTVDQRQAALRFEDPTLVENIRSALQILYEKQAFLKGLIALQENEDPFESSMLLKEAFEFTWSISRSKQDPELVLVDPTQYPVMVMKVDFLQRKDFIECLRKVLPDFLRPHAPRCPTPRARWKELWSVEPTSVAAIEQQLAKLVEQAFWAMALDPAYKTPPAKLHPVEDLSRAFEPWMEEYDKKAAKLRETAKKKNKKQKSRTAPARSTSEEAIRSTVDEEEEEGEEGHDERFRHTSSLLEVQEERAEGASSKANSVVSSDESVFVSGRYLSVPHGQEEPAGAKQEAGTAKSAHVPAGYGEQPPAAEEPPHMPQTPRTPQPASPHTPGTTPLYQQDWPAAETCCPTPSCTASTRTPPSSVENWSRGRWFSPGGRPSVGSTIRAVVRKTFIEIDVGSDAPSPSDRKKSRSLSPRCTSNLAESEDADPWYWYWH